MPTLRRETRLRRRANLRLLINSDNSIEVTFDKSRLHCGVWGLAVLDFFAEPHTLPEALDALGSGSVKEWTDLTSTIIALFEVGMLREADRVEGFEPDIYGWANPAVHVQMLNDRVRTESYLQSISEAVRSDDVVVEIGTGSGILAMAAARAGARHVYSIEASAIADIAEMNIRANGLEDRITVLRGWSHDINLPERGTLLISEIIGSDPLAEDILAVFRDARRRLLIEGARSIPSRLRLCGVLVEIPNQVIGERLAISGTITNWHDWYGVDLSGLKGWRSNSGLPLFRERPDRAGSWRQLSEPMVLAEIDLAGFAERYWSRDIAIPVTGDGLCNGLAMFFEADLGGNVTLSTHPAAAGDRSSWRLPVWYFGEDAAAGAGAEVDLQFEVGETNTAAKIRLKGIRS